MESPEIVEKILSLTKDGWGKRRIAKELGISHKTVTRYRRQGCWMPPKIPKKKGKLQPLAGWVEETFHQHKGNAEVVRQELLLQHKLAVNLRTIERAVKPYRQKLAAEALATIRFETPPGKQLQIDFGSTKIEIAGESQRVYLFIATLGHSRRQYIRAFLHERQSSWFEGLEGAFRHFGGIPEEVLLDNARALVSSHNVLTREVTFNARLNTFASYWKFKPKACAPYRARTKGKDERSVGYVKRNCIAGRKFASWEQLEGHLLWWMREIADVRIHGTTEEKPIERFLRDEVEVLKPMEGKPPFNQIQEYQRVVQADACVEVDTNFYSVPWKWIKQSVHVHIVDDEVIIFLEQEELARHPVRLGRGQRSINPGHLEGILNLKVFSKASGPDLKSAELLRPLSEYEDVIGGKWS